MLIMSGYIYRVTKYTCMVSSMALKGGVVSTYNNLHVDTKGYVVALNICIYLQMMWSWLQAHTEGYNELSGKTKLFFTTAVSMWPNAEFYIKVDDDVHVNLGETD